MSGERGQQGLDLSAVNDSDVLSMNADALAYPGSILEWFAFLVIEPELCPWAFEVVEIDSGLTAVNVGDGYDFHRVTW